MAGPAISVIVPAHHRREYLEAAVASVRAQTIPANEYEILVVKNFDDEAMDRRLRDAGVRLLRTEAAGLGAKLAAGFDASRAPILTFLEDDDLYLPDRLAVVREAFDDPELGAFHNAMDFVDGRGVARATELYRECRRAAYLAPGQRGRHAVRRYLRVSPHFNLSSVAVRRELLGAARDFLARSNLTCDNLVNYAALRSERALTNVGLPLTQYRLHASASWSVGEASELFAREQAKWAEIVRGYELILEMLGDHPVRLFAEGDLRRRRAMLTMAAGRAVEPFPWCELPRLVIGDLARRDTISGPVAAAGVALRALAPSLGGRWYYRYVARQADSLGVAPVGAAHG